MTLMSTGICSVGKQTLSWPAGCRGSETWPFALASWWLRREVGLAATQQRETDIRELYCTEFTIVARIYIVVFWGPQNCHIHRISTFAHSFEEFSTGQWLIFFLTQIQVCKFKFDDETANLLISTDCFGSQLNSTAIWKVWLMIIEHLIHYDRHFYIKEWHGDELTSPSPLHFHKIVPIPIPSLHVLFPSPSFFWW